MSVLPFVAALIVAASSSSTPALEVAPSDTVRLAQSYDPPSGEAPPPPLTPAPSEPAYGDDAYGAPGDAPPADAPSPDAPPAPDKVEKAQSKPVNGFLVGVTAGAGVCLLAGLPITLCSGGLLFCVPCTAAPLAAGGSAFAGLIFGGGGFDLFTVLVAGGVGLAGAVLAVVVGWGLQIALVGAQVGGVLNPADPASLAASFVPLAAQAGIAALTAVAVGVTAGLLSPSETTEQTSVPSGAKTVRARPAQRNVAMAF